MPYLRHLGSARSDLAQIQSYIISSAYKGYIIFFRYAGDEFQVVNILEGHRDAEKHFGVDTESESED